MINQSEAVYGFAAMLTGINDSLCVGSKHDTSFIADLASKFCEINKLPDCREDYSSELKICNCFLPVKVKPIEPSHFWDSISQLEP